MLHYLDLPVLARAPSSVELQNALNELKPSETTDFNAVDPLDRGTKQWLTQLANHELSWLSEKDAEDMRTNAARRLALECGVTASAQRTRTITVGELKLDLVEPGMTEDQLGTLTWGSSLILSRRFARQAHLVSQLRCIELGAGTGLCAITAAKLGAHVDATDLPEIVPSLQHNLDLNGINSTAYPLDWANLPNKEPEKFGVCIVSDPVYSRDHPPLLLAAIKYIHAPCVLLQLPLRKGFEDERAQISIGLEKQGYKREHFEEEAGRDLFGKQRYAYSRWIK